MFVRQTENAQPTHKVPSTANWERKSMHLNYISVLMSPFSVGHSKLTFEYNLSLTHHRIGNKTDTFNMKTTDISIDKILISYEMQSTCINALDQIYE